MALLYELDDIGQVLDRLEADHGAHPEIERARRRQVRVRRTALALSEDRLRYGAAMALRRH